MRKNMLRVAVTFAMTVTLGALLNTKALADDRILNGIYADNIPLGGYTESEATNAIDTCVKELGQRSITLYSVGDEEVTITPDDLGFYWSNREIVDEAVKIGNTGNIVERYKKKKDLEYTSQILKINYSIDENSAREVLTEKCAVFDIDEADGLLTRENGQFIINAGQTGSSLDVEGSIKALVDFFENVWTGENSAFPLVISNSNPDGTYEQLALVKDVLGTFHTNFKTSSSDRCANVSNGARLINGSVIFPGQVFSFYDNIKPFTLANGYKVGAAYAGGKVVDSIGGGICQVSSTLYNSVLLAELEVVERKNHAMIVGYVDPARDATIAESSGIDFKFKNNTDAPIYIEAYTEGKDLYITIFGHETRPSDRQVAYESEILSRTVPEGETIYTDSSLPVGSISITGSHTGYKANLWKIVTQNGEETRELVNTSTYNAVPRYATVGTATNDPNIAAIMSNAIASSDIATVQAAIAQCKSLKEAADSNQAALAAYQAALDAQGGENVVEDTAQ